MQDANVRGWTRESHVSVEMLESLRGLNHRFLDLVGTRNGEWNSPGLESSCAELSGQIAPLSAGQKRAAANCPYALFDLRFHDADYWQTRLDVIGQWSVSDADSADESTLNFVRLALFFAWHVASTATLAAQFLLGMNAVTAAAFRGATIDSLPSLVDTEAANLTARWSDCPAYWNALTAAACGPNSAVLRRIQLYGLQLAAAAHLT